ncbi:MAG: ornithine carbamoyltransferase [Leptolyngbya sp. PLA2]|nr:ornithine carbamoyltransferase [Leptolyngbya sp.]MCE7971784.1 ornithine carbamoyltransferase [Leptolyngbya sp. PL-A2]MCZ7634425.1 ornithine carbamoyltransferase [Phycisphaerales bacterium]MDL1904778.1 ornithine carbamoyltransferase [Synechococcales cyanobacterium CNB]GIK19741.1 MAG: ornithine carbamoyltransferase, catabolic [Planctomycetota bacterium]
MPQTTSAVVPVEVKPSKPAASLAGRDFLSIADFSADDVLDLFETAAAMKADLAPFAGSLAGRSVITLFEKPSLRTRVTFEVGPTKLGAHVMYFDHSKQRIGERESVKDYAKNLDRWVDCIVARVFDHAVLTEMAEHASVPVVNALSDREHPCQALADLFTLRERLGTLAGARVVFLGDGNNVCHSLMLLCAKLGVSFTAVTPRGFEPQFGVVRDALADAKRTGATITLSHTPEAAAGHHAVYTDCWVSMGQDHQAALRDGAFTPYRADDDMMALASRGIPGGALFMHCLPAHRGEEVTDEVIDSPASIVYDQAENRMWTQNALLWRLLGAAGR